MQRTHIPIGEAGVPLGVSRSTLFPLMDYRQQETVKIGRRRLVKREAIAALVERGSIDLAAKQ
ncbi:excisionase [Erythrobacter oryzae]|uniref:excisionase n=1 Tax=Erythrobacter oryzae TaxID=3019556 RepID=UPI002557B818|nr:excisionase [Erythrobacter sp. COR-2]